MFLNFYRLFLFQNMNFIYNIYGEKVVSEEHPLILRSIPHLEWFNVIVWSPKGINKEAPDTTSTLDD